MDLHQINLTYLRDEDRLLCRASFRDTAGELHEVRAWLTRRIVGELWLCIVQALKAQVALDQPQAAHVRQDVVGMEHVGSVARSEQQGNFAQPYEAGAKALPLGAEPLLVTRLTFNLRAGEPMRIDLAPAEGQGFELALTPHALHGFCAVLGKALANSGWGLELVMPGLGTAEDVPRLLN